MPVAVKTKPVGGVSAPVPGTSRPPSGKRPASASSVRPLSAAAALSPHDPKRSRLDAAQPLAASPKPAGIDPMPAASSPAAKALEQPASSTTNQQDMGAGAGLSSLLGKLSAQLWPTTGVSAIVAFVQL